MELRLPGSDRRSIWSDLVGGVVGPRLAGVASRSAPVLQFGVIPVGQQTTHRCLQRERLVELGVVTGLEYFDDQRDLVRRARWIRRLTHS
jgi:hypothetical protein